jgi:hypothetical protein
VSFIRRLAIQRGESETLHPFSEVLVIQIRHRFGQIPDIGELNRGPALARPLELGEDQVLRGHHEQLLTLDGQAAPPRELRPSILGLLPYDDVHLYHQGRVDHVERRRDLDCVMHGSAIDVKIVFKQATDAIDVSR